MIMSPISKIWSWILIISILPVLIAVFFIPTLIRRTIISTLLRYTDPAPPPPPAGDHDDNIRSDGPLVQLYPNLWTLTASLSWKQFYLPRTMIIYQIPASTSSLLIHSPISVSPHITDQIDALGTVRYIIIPNRCHRLDCQSWTRRYPDAQVVTPSFTQEFIRGWVSDVTDCESIMAQYPAKPTSDQIPGIQYMTIGSERFELGYILALNRADHHSNAVALIVTDTLFNLDLDMANIGLDLMGSTDGCRISKFGVLLSDDLPALLDWISDLTQINIDSVMMAHGRPLIGSENIISELTRAAHRLSNDMALYSHD